MRQQLLQLLQVVDRLQGVDHLAEDVLHLAHLHLAAADAQRRGVVAGALVLHHPGGELVKVAELVADPLRRLVGGLHRQRHRVAELRQRSGGAVYEQCSGQQGRGGSGCCRGCRCRCRR